MTIYYIAIQQLDCITVLLTFFERNSIILLRFGGFYTYTFTLTYNTCNAKAEVIVSASTTCPQGIGYTRVGAGSTQRTSSNSLPKFNGYIFTNQVVGIIPLLCRTIDHLFLICIRNNCLKVVVLSAFGRFRS